MIFDDKLIEGFECLTDEELGSKMRKILSIIMEQRKENQDREQKQKLCKHKNTFSEVSEYHQNGEPDRWKEYCKDCGKLLSS